MPTTIHKTAESIQRKAKKQNSIKHTRIMKKIFLIAICSLFFFGCNINPNKEARISKLETEIMQSIDKINKLESRVKIIEDLNNQLKTRVIELEK